MRGSVEQRLLAPPFAAGDGEQEVAAEQAVRLDERLEVLARLERGDGEHVRRAEVGAVPSGREDVAHAGVRDADPLRRDARASPTTSSPVNAGVDEDEVAGAGGVRVLAAVHRRACAALPIPGSAAGTRSWMVVARNARSLRRVHPVGEVQHVERAEQALGRGTTAPAPPGAQRVRGRQRPEAELDVDPSSACRIRAGPRRLVGAKATISCRPPGRFGQSRERAADVVPDPGQRMRQRRHVDDDPHRAGR